MLESQLHYKSARDLDGNRASGNTGQRWGFTPANTPQVRNPQEEQAREETVPRCQVFHRVPSSRSEATHEYNGINGQIPVPNVGYYMEQHPGVAFVVLKVHHCGDVTRPPRRDGRMLERQEKIQVVSPVLGDALRHIAEFEPYDGKSDESRSYLGEMDAPYLFFYHHYQKLKDFARKDGPYKATLAPLIQFLEQNYDEEYRTANELFDRGFVTRFHAAKLYKPFDVVIARDRKDHSLQAAVLSRLPRKQPPLDDENQWSLDGWSWRYNGRHVKRENWSSDTGAFQTDEFPINELAIYPLKYAKPEKVEKFRETGRRFWSMRNQGLRCYTGWDHSHEHYYVFFDKWPQKIDATEEMPPDCELLLPSVIKGFHLGSKKWVMLNVDGFLPLVDWNKNAFKQLVLDARIKEMIHALVDVQKSRDKAMNDIIKGKGNGLIILLHGSPGTGKTLTAESVAEIAEKPLYRVTCGDIGTNAQDVETYLETVLYLGKKWDCVLLLDEADVFLEERTMADLARNSLVSVFLRVLEYHEGILILTSNRVGTFDEAFKSRIQVAIHYDNLTKKSRKAIWRNFFDMIEESDEGANVPELERRLDELAGEEMNGRQIRNALLTARQLAQHRNERLDWEHLNQVMKTSAAFNKYLKTVKGHTDDRWAREEGIR
ncbi:hypothetical protein PG985_009865 [Apiospora marii]|uniref:uncharacterized protein n=1 Tax=Apiospora marii TaxID=335849 RepID=UPI0031329472